MSEDISYQSERTFNLRTEGGIDCFYIYVVMCQLLEFNIEIGVIPFDPDNPHGVLGNSLSVTVKGPKDRVIKLQDLYKSLNTNILISKLSRFLADNLEVERKDHE